MTLAFHLIHSHSSRKSWEQKLTWHLKSTMQEWSHAKLSQLTYSHLACFSSSWLLELLPSTLLRNRTLTSASSRCDLALQTSSSFTLTQDHNSERASSTKALCIYYSPCSTLTHQTGSPLTRLANLTSLLAIHLH